MVEVGNKYQISPGLYYKWRDEFFAHGPGIFGRDRNKQDKQLKSQHSRLKTIIGEITTELKNGDTDVSGHIFKVSTGVSNKQEKGVQVNEGKQLVDWYSKKIDCWL